MWPDTSLSMWLTVRDAGYDADADADADAAALGLPDGDQKWSFHSGSSSRPWSVSLAAMLNTWGGGDICRGARRLSSRGVTRTGMREANALGGLSAAPLLKACTSEGTDMRSLAASSPPPSTCPPLAASAALSRVRSRRGILLGPNDTRRLLDGTSGDGCSSMSPAPSTRMAGDSCCWARGRANGTGNRSSTELLLHLSPNNGRAVWGVSSRAGRLMAVLGVRESRALAGGGDGNLSSRMKPAVGTKLSYDAGERITSRQADSNALIRSVVMMMSREAESSTCRFFLVILVSFFSSLAPPPVVSGPPLPPSVGAVALGGGWGSAMSEGSSSAHHSRTRRQALTTPSYCNVISLSWPET
mmetsp:Transcript_34587/g.85754  ORF Transcript_34587/g.85754 Transcript_34587/m.85754 type:complete len:358 (-) Transcript_34587:3445-4518(-)